jgi:hypothetical protein
MNSFIARRGPMVQHRQAVNTWKERDAMILLWMIHNLTNYFPVFSPLTILKM